MMQQVMSATSKVIVDQKGGNSLLYLPLDKLTQAATAAAPMQLPALQLLRLR
jgi:membrane protease subunit HflK